MNTTEKMVLTLYGDGTSVADIAERLRITDKTVYAYLHKHGVNQRKQCANVFHQFGISRYRISQARRKTQEGSRIRVKSVKASMYGDLDGKIRKGCIPKTSAKVLSTASKYFCLVELPGGTIESILWIDMVGETLDRY